MTDELKLPHPFEAAFTRVERRLSDMWEDAKAEWCDACGGPGEHEIFAQKILSAIRDELRRAASQSPSSAPSCTCPSGDGSLRWPCPVHQASAASEDDFRNFVVMVRPGMVPARKGPLADKKHVEDMLRELYSLHPDCQCMVIRMPEQSYPQSGIEWIDMYGDKRRTSIREVIASKPAPAGAAKGGNASEAGDAGKAAQDAERYRWLRNEGSARGVIDWGALGVGYQALEEMDSAIDAAIAVAKQKGE